MCSKNTPPKLKSKSMIKINKRIRTTVSLKPSRKIRTKTRKPKFLSLLRLDSSPETSQQSGEMTHDNNHHHHHQLNLFPLHPENLVEDKDLHDENNMAYLFSTSDDTTATTLTGLLDSKTETVILSEEDSVSPPSLTYAYGGGQDSEEAAGGAVSLVRTALRNRERDASEEKWVCYSEVVEEKKKKKKVEEEVSSCFADARDYSVRTQQRHRLSLKLDYQEILNAWCDKGPLYVEGECPQTVPDLHHDQFLPHHSGSNVLMDGLWRVPENSKIVSMEEEMNGGRGDHGGWKIGQREASVLRYKEKRQSRLFSKRIRYEVRKVNAEKRPRMKGRFVKRS